MFQLSKKRSWKGKEKMNASNDFLDKQYKFQLEQPEEQDLFQGKGHENAANGIYNVLVKNKNVHIIGVEGGLGAGKSTVIKILENKLDKEVYSFVYFDADRYQHSSTKAAFVKVFYNELKCIVKSDRYEDINKAKNEALGNHLNYTKSTNSNISLYVIAFLATVFLSLRNLKESIEIILTAIPNIFNNEGFFNLTDFITVLCFLSPLTLIPAMWWSNKGKKENEKITLGNILKRNSKDSVDEVLEVSREVGSFELKKAFESFSEAIPADKTLILVIDNIDRVDQDKAKEVWSDLDVFTSLSNERVKIILPYSEAHLANSISESSIEGKEYISKRLPVVFRAPPIVSAGWREQFYSYWDETLGGVQDKESCAELIDIWRERSYQVTPRMLKKHVNDIACTLESNVLKVSALSCSAYHLAQKHNISIEKLLSTNDEDVKENNHVMQLKATRRVLNSSLNIEEWSTQIMCIYYQTSEDIAKSELLVEPISQAISLYDAKKILDLSDVYGFSLFFNRAIIRNSSVELIKLSSYIVDLDSSEKNSWLNHWLPVINEKTSQEDGLIDFDQDYIDSVIKLRSHDYEVNLKFVRKSIDSISALLKEDDEKADVALEEIYAYSQVEKEIPEAVIEVGAEIFVEKLWPNRPNFEGWHLNKIHIDKDKLIGIVELSVVKYQKNTHWWNIFKWLMKKHKVGMIDYRSESSPAASLSLELNSIGNYSCFVFPYFKNSYDDTFFAGLLVALKSEKIKSKKEEWIALVVLLAAATGKYNEKINHRLANGNVSPVNVKDDIGKLLEGSSVNEEITKKIILTMPSFLDLLPCLKIPEYLSWIGESIKHVIVYNEVDYLEVNKLVVSEEYGYLSELFTSSKKDDLLSFLENWVKDLEISLVDASERLVSDIVSSSNEEWKSKLKSDFEDSCDAEQYSPAIFISPSKNIKTIVDWLESESYVLKASAKVRSGIEQGIKDCSKGLYKELTLKHGWFDKLFSILHGSTRQAIFRSIKVKFSQETTSYVERYLIIRGFPESFKLEEPSNNVAINIQILLLENANNEDVFIWLDNQEWTFSNWNQEQIEHFVMALKTHEENFEFQKLKENPLLSKYFELPE